MLAAALGIIFLFKSGELGEGIRKGLHICSYSVIPALFPFMAISIFICKSEAGDIFSLLFSPITKLLHLPKNSAGALFASFIGGYPTSAKCINELVLEEKIDRKTASKMLCFCVNAGPPFLISAVGIGIFGNIVTGFLLFAAQFLSAAVIGIFCSLFIKNGHFQEYPLLPKRKSNASCVTEAVISAAESCFNMCAFIVLSCGILELLENSAIFSAAENPLAKAFFAGIIEVTAGCFAAGKAEGFSAIVAAGAIASFSGISVMLQVAAATEQSRINLLPFFVSLPPLFLSYCWDYHNFVYYTKKCRFVNSSVLKKGKKEKYRG